MKSFHKISAMLVLFFFIVSAAFSQNIDVDAYKQFLEKNKGLTAEGLFKMYPPGLYNAEVSTNVKDAEYFEDFNKKIGFSKIENDLLTKHGFMVSERHSYETMWKAFRHIYKVDLPVFISTDAILHSIHMSYDAILKDIEHYVIIANLDRLLKNMHNELENMEVRYADFPEMKKSLLDYDIYLTIARQLLSGSDMPHPYFSENQAEINKIKGYIESESAWDCKLFSDTQKSIDFSQFTVRGHYTQTQELSNYFQSMMWLGRIELYLIPPESAGPQQTPEDIQRQIIDALLIYEGAVSSGAYEDLMKLDALLKAFIGESDNVQLPHLGELMDEMGLESAAELLDMNKVEAFQQALAQKSYADQKILSQILWGGPGAKDEIKPASAFLLFGQRFIIDSYVTGNVVHDKVTKRMLPSSLDVLFTFGNNAASDILKHDLKAFEGADYPLNLAGLRYLAESYEDDFWSSSIYNGWLSAIRSLSPPDDTERKFLPEFMQTAAWWQQKMNTQCASWAQLRHDNLLYAKQSYSGGITCFYPYGYVEPIPEFYKAVKDYALSAGEKIKEHLNSGLEMNSTWGERFTEKIDDYFSKLSNYSDTLLTISEKELTGASLTDNEKKFIKTIFSEVEHNGCGVVIEFTGWYSKLFYFQKEDADKIDNLIADIHTAPTDENGNPVGWVMHVGTGPINLAVVTARNWDGKLCTFAGPVMSYYEHVTTGFKRLTDEEWALDEMYLSDRSMRPAFTDLYLATKDQWVNPDPVSLPTRTSSVEDNDTEPTISQVSNFPNPFDSHTYIKFQIPSTGRSYMLTVSIFDADGKLINTIYNGSAPSGNNYSLKWDGTDASGKKVLSGVYLYEIRIDEKTHTGKMLLTR
jgi:hypothetical protein